jgi:hypothetical protein
MLNKQAPFSITQHDLFKTLTISPSIPLKMLSDSQFMRYKGTDICDWQQIEILRIPSVWTVIDLKVKLS